MKATHRHAGELMKVLQVINSLSTGGAERLLLDTIPLFNERGTQMDLLLLDGTPHPFLDALRALRCCKVHVVGTSARLRNPMFAFRIAPFLKQYDVVHVHLFPALYLVAMARVVSRSRAKLIFTEHSTSNRRMRQAWLGALQTVMYNRYDRVVCITREVCDVLKRHTGMGDEKFVVIENGVTLAKILDAVPLPRAELFPDTNAKILIQVASFQEPKDQPTVIRALARLPQHVKLLFVGDGPLRANAEALVQQLRLQDRVKFLGVRMDVPRMLKSSDVVVLSSKHEGLSLSSIEGMASGRPFVASDAPGLTDMVSGAGILFPTQDDAALAAVIERLLTDPTQYADVVKAGLERARQFDIQTMVTRHIELYQALANGAA
ncbi:MAG: glycosyltransferase [Gemmatimonadaceae bacterium]